MGALEVSLESIHRGFVTGYGAQLIPGGDVPARSTLETAAVVTYFARLGVMLGYAVRCEKTKRSDLVWLRPEEPARSPILHLESENSDARAVMTVTEKLGRSDAQLRVAHLNWVRRSTLDRLRGALVSLAKRPRASYLVIARDWDEYDTTPEGVYKYRVRAWNIEPDREPRLKELRKAMLAWPLEGALHMYWPSEDQE